MMYMPALFGEDLMDDWMDDMDRAFSRKNPLFGRSAKNLMKTDVRELDNAYELAVDLPGFRKDEIKLELKDGCLVISAAKGVEKDDKDKKGRMIRNERYSGAVERSFYVGEDVTEDEVKAKFEDGVLRITIPKKDGEKKTPEHKLIAIAG